jgi:ADP-ribose pyrophosphatase YjhB (NUDIX family)
MANLIPTIGIVATSHDGRILLIREGKKSGHITGMYGLVSGRVEEGETESDSAVREFHEETGLNANVSDLTEFENNYYIADIPRKDGTIAHFGWRVFKLQNFNGDLKETEETKPEWFELSRIELLEREGKLLPNVLNAIRAALK